MTQQFDQFQGSIDLSRKWSNLALGNFEQITSLYLDQFESLFDRSSALLKEACGDLERVEAPGQWSDLALAGLRKAGESFREAALGVSNCQVESLRLLQEQAEEARKLLAASLTQHFAHLEAVHSAHRSVPSTVAAARKLAA